MTVTSMGLTSPFKTLRQYKKFGEEVGCCKGKSFPAPYSRRTLKDSRLRDEGETGVQTEGGGCREYSLAFNEVKHKISNQIQITYIGKKKETIILIDTFSEFNELKNIDKATLISVLEEAFRNVISKATGTDENYDIIINPDRGDLEIWRNRVIVEDDELENPNLQVTLSEALTIDDDFEIGEELTDAVSLDRFGRRTILNLRQTLASKILELEKDNLFNKYKEKVGEIVSGELYQVWKKDPLTGRRNVLIFLKRNDTKRLLPQGRTRARSGGTGGARTTTRR